MLNNSPGYAFVCWMVLLHVVYSKYFQQANNLNENSYHIYLPPEYRVNSYQQAARQCQQNNRSVLAAIKTKRTLRFLVRRLQELTSAAGYHSNMLQLKITDSLKEK